MSMDLKGRVIFEAEAAQRELKALGKDANQLEKELKQAGKAAKTSSSDFDKMGKALASKALTALAPAAIGAGLLAAGKASIELAQEQIRVEKQLDAVIRSTGGAAGLTAAEIKKMASAFQSTTNFGDEATIAGQNLLLTFTNIGRDVFPDATRTMLDMSAALGQGLKQSAIQLGKALNDPITGVSALREVGVSFTQTQMDMVRSMVEAGNTAGAQALILDELNREFGGSAEAAREADGGMIALSNAIGDLGEVIGTAALPKLTDLATKTREAVEAATTGTQSLIDRGKQNAAVYDEMGISQTEYLSKLQAGGDIARQASDDYAAALEILNTQSEATAEAQQELSFATANAALKAADAAAATLTLAEAQLQQSMAAATARYSGMAEMYGAELNQPLGEGYIEDTLARLEKLRNKEVETAEDASAAWQKSYNEREAAAQSAAESVLSEGFNVLSDLGLDLGGGDAGRDIAENARRLAIVASKGYVDQMDSSIQALAAERPDLMNQLMTSGNPGELARSILQDFEMGVDSYGLIDEEKAKERINRMLFAGEKRKELIDRITQEILSEGQFSADQVNQAVGQAFGTATGQTAAAMPEEQLAQVQAITGEIDRIGTSAETSAAMLSEAFTGTLDPLENLRLALEEIVSIVERVEVVAAGAAGAVTGLGNSVGLEPAGNVPGYATGGSYTVPGSGGPDSRMFMARVTPGERIDFTPPGQAQSRAQSQTVVVPVYLDSQLISKAVGASQANAAEQLARMGGVAQL